MVKVFTFCIVQPYYGTSHSHFSIFLLDPLLFQFFQDWISEVSRMSVIQILLHSYLPLNTSPSTPYYSSPLSLCQQEVARSELVPTFPNNLGCLVESLSWLVSAWSRKPSPPPNPGHSESLQTKEENSKSNSTLLTVIAASFSKVASCPNPCLKCSAFDHI